MDDLKLIKRHYGEKMMHLCRELFPTLLEKDGLLFNTLTSKFAYNRHLYDDITSRYYQEYFKDLIYKEIDKKRNHKDSIKSPFELMEEAGYTLYECHTEEDIQAFKKYYTKEEELCTFNGGRLNRCIVFFAVKKNVDEIKRENFKEPDRQDEYGTSVISIQFSRGNSNTLSIKNRYNHTVNNPDATFSNNLDNIIEGLTDAFTNSYGLEINGTTTNFILPNYVLADDGKYYKYNYEIDNTYYCTNNIVIDNFEPIKYDTSRYILFDYYLLDMQKKTITNMCSNKADGFIDSIGKIESIKVKNNKDNKNILINGYIELTINNKNQIIKYKNEKEKSIKSAFLKDTRYVEEIDLPNVETIGNDFLRNNNCLKKINIPNAKTIQNSFLHHDRNLKEIDLPNVETIGDSFIGNNIYIEKVNIPIIRTIGDYFLVCAEKLENIDLPKVESIGSCFLSGNKCIEEISLPNVEMIKNYFLANNHILNKLSLPKVKYIGTHFLADNYGLEEIDLPEVIIIGEQFIKYNKKIKTVSLPKLTVVDYNFLERNQRLESIKLPNVKEIRSNFLYENNILKEISLPNVEAIENSFLSENVSLEKIDLPKCKKIDSYFLDDNYRLKEINLPVCESVSDDFLKNHESLELIYAPQLTITTKYPWDNVKTVYVKEIIYTRINKGK